MIGYTLNFTRKADKDESDIYKYIADKFGEVYAKKFRKNFIEFCHLVTKQPFIGRPAKTMLHPGFLSSASKVKLYIK